MRDLLKVGVFMMGVALMIIAVLGVLIYTRTLPKGEPSFWANCLVAGKDMVITVHAGEDLSRVVLKRPEDIEIGEGENILSGSEWVFPVREEGVYVLNVETGKGRVYTRTVVCQKPIPISGD